MKNGDHVWGLKYYFTSSPALGEDTMQRVIIFGMKLDIAFRIKSCDCSCVLNVYDWFILKIEVLVFCWRIVQVTWGRYHVLGLQFGSLFIIDLIHKRD